MCTGYSSVQMLYHCSLLASNNCEPEVFVFVLNKDTEPMMGEKTDVITTFKA
jgi:hypothetical protein